MRDGEKGALRDFLIVGGLLALVLVGGLYGLNRYNAEQAAENNSEQATNDENSSTTEQAERDRQEAADRERAERESREAEVRRAEQAEKEAAEREKQEVAAVGSNDSNKTLPQTGPADTLMGLVAVTALSFAGFHYFQSRRTT